MVRQLLAGKRLVFAAHFTICIALVVLAGLSQRPEAQPLGGDLIVRGDILSQQWVVRDELIGQVCSAEEGNATPDCAGCCVSRS